MQTVRLGRTNAQVSVAGLGCGGHSRLGMAQGADAHQASRIVRRAIDLGVNFIDTAPGYRTEDAVGLGIAGHRDHVFLSTKVSPNTGGPAGGGARITAADLTLSLEASLRRLGTDYVDVLHLHGVKPDQYAYCAEVLVPEMQRQRQAGKLRFLGVTEQFIADTTHAMLPLALADDLFDVVMVGFNMINPSARKRVFPQTLAKDVGTLVMFAVRRQLSDAAALKAAVAGLIARGEVDAALIDAEDPLDFVREHAGLIEAGYRFCRHEQGAQVVLFGTGNADHLASNIAAIQAPPLPVQARDRLARLFGDVDSVSGN